MSQAEEHGAGEHGAGEHGAGEHGAGAQGAGENGAGAQGAGEHGAGGEPAGVRPGPGVRPPFLTPPSDGSVGRRWWAIGLGVATLVAVCLGCVGGFIALGALGTNMVAEQERAAVVDYLTALKEERFGAAWAQQCPALRSRTGLLEFGQRQGNRPRISTFTVAAPTDAAATEASSVAPTGSSRATSSSSPETVVPATIAYANGEQERLEFLVTRGDGDRDYEVCGSR